MKRIFVAAAFAFGMLLMGATSASASSLCTIDPTVSGNTVYASSSIGTITISATLKL